MQRCLGCLTKYDKTEEDAYGFFIGYSDGYDHKSIYCSGWYTQDKPHCFLFLFNSLTKLSQIQSAYINLASIYDDSCIWCKTIYISNIKIDYFTI